MKEGLGYKDDWIGSVERLINDCRNNSHGFHCGNPNSRFEGKKFKAPCTLITGGAGFIGSHVADRLLQRGDCVAILDNVNDFYDVRIKQSNLAMLVGTHGRGQVRLYLGDMTDSKFVQRVFESVTPEYVIHLAGKAGVRPSIMDPSGYVDANVHGTINLLEQSRLHKVKHFVYASSSSVYGGSTKKSFSESDMIDKPISPYAASKASVELFANTYHHLYNLNVTGFRFFTVYGPRGRPDMAPFKFIDIVLNNRFIDQYGDGSTSRDYTYIDDIVSGVVAAVDNPQGSKIYNLGNGSPVTLRNFISEIEKATRKTVKIRMQPLQMGDTNRTCANIARAQQDLNYAPNVSISDGIENTVKWYKQYILPYDENGNPRTLWKLSAEERWAMLARVSEMFELPHLMRNTDSNVLQPSKTDLVDVEINCRQNMHLWAQKPKQYSSIFFVFHVLAIAFITSYFCCRFPNWFVGYEILF